MRPRRIRVQGLSLLLLIAIIIMSAAFFFADINNESSGQDAILWEDVVRRRLQRLEKSCQSQKELINDKNRRSSMPRGYVFHESTGLAYCHMPKVASTFWLEKMARLVHPELSEEDLGEIMATKDGLHRLMLTNTTSNAPLGVPESSLFRMVFVRHPLRRLVSAYLSKIADPEDPERQAFLAPLLRFLRRRSASGRLAENVRISFPDFVDFVLDEVGRGRSSFGSLHWVPFNWLCAVCEHRMSMIGKLETMSEDLNYLADKFPALSPLVADSSKVNSANSQEYKKYLEQLSERQMSSLCSLYKEDFDMFGYDCDV